MSEEVQQPDNGSTESLKEKLAFLESEASKQEARISELWAKVVAAEASGQTLQQTIATLQTESTELSKANADFKAAFESHEETLNQNIERLDVITKNFTDY